MSLYLLERCFREGGSRLVNDRKNVGTAMTHQWFADHCVPTMATQWISIARPFGLHFGSQGRDKIFDSTPKG